jgi:GNAT superfamily N-acetyltransferase
MTDPLIRSYTPRPRRLNWPGVGPVEVRALSPADFELEKAFVLSLSREAIHQRTLGGIVAPTDDQIRQLVGVEHGSHMALAMIVASMTGPRIISVARYGPALDESFGPSLEAINGLGDLANRLSPALEDPEIVSRPAPIARPCAEFAIIVGEGWQGKGIARGMLLLLEQVAKRAGYRSMMGQTFHGNDSMIGLARATGYRTTIDPEDSTLKRMVKPLRRLRRAQ